MDRAMVGKYIPPSLSPLIGVSIWIKEIAHKNSLFAHNPFSTLFFSTKMIESKDLVLVSCIIDFDDMKRMIKTV